MLRNKQKKAINSRKKKNKISGMVPNLILHGLVDYVLSHWPLIGRIYSHYVVYILALVMRASTYFFGTRPWGSQR